MSDKKLNWNITKDEKIEDFKIFSLRKSTRINPRTDKPYTFLLMDGYDWVNLFALTTNKEIILVKQYRHGADCETLELPGGCIEPNRNPAASAKRELQEETGYSVSKIEPLGSLYANPAYKVSECITIFHLMLCFQAILTWMKVKILSLLKYLLLNLLKKSERERYNML